MAHYRGLYTMAAIKHMQTSVKPSTTRGRGEHSGERTDVRHSDMMRSYSPAHTHKAGP